MVAWRITECGSSGGQPADWVQCTLEFPKTRRRKVWLVGQYSVANTYILEENVILLYPIL